MKFDGIIFRKNANIVLIPDHLATPEFRGYAFFGRLVPRNVKQIPKDAWPIRQYWNPENLADPEPKFAKPIANDGYSRTNMMYGADGRIYLAKDGVCYVSAKRRAI